MSLHTFFFSEQPSSSSPQPPKATTNLIQATQNGAELLVCAHLGLNGCLFLLRLRLGQQRAVQDHVAVLAHKTNKVELVESEHTNKSVFAITVVFGFLQLCIVY